jgi:hypothetical protein
MTQSLFDDPDDAEDVFLADLRAAIGRLGYAEVARIVRSFAPTHIQASAPARPTDPETSHLASKRSIDIGRFSAKSRQAKLLQIFSMRDLTDQQATIHLVGSHAAPSAFDGCRRRCSDLRAVGYLYDTGRRRKNAGSDDLSIIWGISQAGLRALELIDTTGWSRA